MACLACGRGFHSECEIGCSDCHPDYQKATQMLSATGSGRGAPTKNAEDIKDPYSTGRKRAAIQYPLFRTNPCEWRGFKNCGGGVFPIVGCIAGKQEARHHGPVKNPLRNEPGNVHRICHECHNRWHALNDADYIEEDNEKLPHMPERATEIELMASEAERRIKK